MTAWQPIATAPRDGTRVSIALKVLEAYESEEIRWCRTVKDGCLCLVNAACTVARERFLEDDGAPAHALAHELGFPTTTAMMWWNKSAGYADVLARLRAASEVADG